LRRRTTLSLLNPKDVDAWLAGPGRPHADGFRAELRVGWFLGRSRVRRRILDELVCRWNDDARFRLDVEQSLRSLPECLLDVARRLAANQLLALSSEDSVRRLVAVPRPAAAEALARRVHRELAPLHSLERYPGLLSALLHRLAVATEDEGFRTMHRTSTPIPAAPQALVLGGERRLRWGSTRGTRGTWWVLETRLSSNDFTQDEARRSMTRSLRPALRKLRKDLARREPESRASIGDRAVSVAVEPAVPALPPGPRRHRRPESGVVVVRSADLDAHAQGAYVGVPGPTGSPSANTHA